MPNLHPNSTNYFHSYEPNTNDLTMAMDYNGLGQPVLRTAFNPTATDAFGRFRVAEPHTLFDSTLRYGDDTREWDTAVVTGGSVTHLPNESTMAMDVTTAADARVIRETKRVFLYQPGKSHLTMNTFVFAEGKAGLRQRVGLFDDRNGIFVEREGTTAYIVKRSYISGSTVDVRVAQADWNSDRLDGTGDSTVSLDWTKVQIMWADIEWLGAGTIRIGFVINGQFRVAHVFHHANILGTVYMTSATLPIRYEIENVAETASASRMRHICNTVISEGGHTPRVTTRSVSDPLTGKNLTTGIETPLLAIRLKSDRLGSVAVPAIANLYGLQSNPFKYSIYSDVTLTGGTWVSAGAESHVEYNITATAITGGRKHMEGIFVGGTVGQETQVMFHDFNSSFQLRRKINGTAEIFVITAQPTSNNDGAICSLIWSEYN